MNNQEKITLILDELAIEYRLVNHPAVFTVAESLQHVKDKRPIKNLLLQEKGKGRKFLVIMDGNARLDLKAITQRLETRKLSFADTEVMQQTLGVSPGAVSVFGLVHNGSVGVEVVLDKTLLAEKELGFHPNENTSTVFFSGEALTKIIEHTGHKTHILDLA